MSKLYFINSSSDRVKVVACHSGDVGTPWINGKPRATEQHLNAGEAGHYDSTWWEMHWEDVVKYLIEGTVVAGTVAFVIATAGGGAPVAAAEVVADVSGEAVTDVTLTEAGSEAIGTAVEQTDTTLQQYFNTAFEAVKANLSKISAAYAGGKTAATFFGKAVDEMGKGFYVYYKNESTGHRFKCHNLVMINGDYYYMIGNEGDDTNPPVWNKGDWDV